MFITCLFLGQPLEFMVIGDWGERFLPSQESVADAMAMYAGVRTTPLYYITYSLLRLYPTTPNYFCLTHGDYRAIFNLKSS